jgi:hypothetical protein
MITKLELLQHKEMRSIAGGGDGNFNGWFPRASDLGTSPSSGGKYNFRYKGPPWSRRLDRRIDLTYYRSFHGWFWTNGGLKPEDFGHMHIDLHVPTHLY